MRARLFAVVLVVGLVAAFVTRLYQKGVDLPALASELQSLRVYWWLPPAYVAAYVLLTTCLAPGSILSMLAGAIWGFGPGVVLGLFACNLACNVQFLGARWLLRDRLGTTFRKAGLDELNARAEHEGLAAVLFLRMIPMPMVLANALAGVSRVRWWQFAVGSFIGTLPMAIAVTFFASTVVDGATQAGRAALWKGLGLAVALAVVTLTVQAFGRRWLAKRRAARTP